MADMKQVREALLEIDIAVHNLWDLGKNVVVGWRTDAQGIQVCLAPCNRVMALAAKDPKLLHGTRLMDARTFSSHCKRLRTRPLRLPLPFKVGTDRDKGEVDAQSVEGIIRRYAIMQTDHRAVVLFDLTGFAAAAPVEQVAQSVALEYAINAAAEQMAQAALPVELARSTAGDGFLYVWNRNSGLDADLRTYVAMLLVLLNNELARRSGAVEGRLLPSLRAALTVGSHYSYHPVEGTKPRSFEYATGQITITLARILSKALPGQILIGSFKRPNERGGEELDPLLFLAHAERLTSKLAGVKIDERAIQEIRSMLTGGTAGGKKHSVLKYRIDDKHGFQHEALNVRARLALEGLDPLEVGLRASDLSRFDATPLPYDISLAAPRPAEPERVG